MKKFIVLAIILMLSAALLVGVSGCSTSKTTALTTVTSTSGNDVSIVNFSFTPETRTVSVGTTVTWTNNDSATHHVASDTGVFDSGDMSQNATFSFTFNNTGTFHYHCTIHTYMKGTIIVQ
jgi:plastocyanin